MSIIRRTGIEPIVVARECGGYLALSPSSYGLKIGVPADTASEARIKFETTLSKSLRIREEARKAETLNAV